ncbi:unnamed protein product [Oikopleura dioica]|uniref:Uncharacterized protein n=1 Tax=Oikopleura dioica TaxID=34765 RepID=E4XWS5_OIKDI|nr:unnamed protein product [Oikopleura dioica]
MKLFSTIIFFAATADARRRKNNKNAEEGSGEGSGVAPVTGEDAATVVGDLVNGIVAAGKAIGQRSNALDKRVKFLEALGAFTIPEGECTTPYNADSYGGDDFANWAATVTTNGNRCSDATAIQTGLGFFLDNYACTDGVTSRKTKRWGKILDKITNYCN